MQKLEGTTIKINRGDLLNLTLSITLDGDTPYTFQVNDSIVFSVYNKNSLDKSALLIKETIIEEASETANITLTSEDTKIGELINKPVDYWYEIELNGQYTVIGYDDDGAKIFRLYPEGSKVI